MFNILNGKFRWWVNVECFDLDMEFANDGEEKTCPTNHLGCVCWFAWYGIHFDWVSEVINLMQQFIWCPQNYICNFRIAPTLWFLHLEYLQMHRMCVKFEETFKYSYSQFFLFEWSLFFVLQFYFVTAARERHSQQTFLQIFINFKR